MATIQCEAELCTISGWTLLRLPARASAQLPSRGMTMVEGTMNGVHFHAALEPDGMGSHWFKLDTPMLEATGADAGDSVCLVIAPTKACPEPEVPVDVQRALTANPAAQTLWLAITPMARWDWIRWIRATPNPETRQRRIAVACSKLTAGSRRPCCFNRNLCTDPAVSTNGVLRDPRER